LFRQNHRNPLTITHALQLYGSFPYCVTDRVAVLPIASSLCLFLLTNAYLCDIINYKSEASASTYQVSALALAPLCKGDSSIMKHTDWLRLYNEGESLCSILRQQGYQCRKEPHRLSWRLQKDSQLDSYVLTWLPAPVSEWSLLPNNPNLEQTELYAILQQALIKLRGEMTRLEPQEYSRPWAIVRLLPDARRYTVARFFNRQDAEDHLRFLTRFIPAAKFELIFDVPNEN
jgi:hypothetical protein